MRKRQDILDLDINLDSISLGEVYSGFRSEFGEYLTDGSSSTAKAGGASSTPGSTAMVTTTEVPIPVSTLIVGTTIVRTSFVTVHITTDTNRPKTTSSSSSQPAESTGSELPLSGDQGQQTSLPEVVTGNPTSTLSLNPSKSLETPTGAATPKPSGGHDSQKYAIIGGLAGAIAGLVLIGILLCVCLRRRRHCEDDQEHQSISEKGLRPAIVRKWSEMTASRSLPKSDHTPPVTRRSSTPDFDGGPIRMSLDHWPRPFAHGESFRESVGPGQLRVMNPDQTKPTTPLPRSSHESDSSFLKRQRSAIGAVLFGANRSRANSFKGLPAQGSQVPTIAIDPALSTECIARTAPTPSFRSYSSVSSFPVVQQQPPEDPFLTPPDEREELSPISPPPTAARRPSLAPLQNVAGAAGRTLSHIGSSLNPFRSKPQTAEGVKTPSRNSISTFSSAGDPFKLDRPSIYESYTQGRAGSEFSREYLPNHTMYEGT